MILYTILHSEIVIKLEPSAFVFHNCREDVIFIAVGVILVTESKVGISWADVHQAYALFG